MDYKGNTKKQKRSSNADTAGSSSSTVSGGEYEVYLSFRGKDTRKSFADYLYHDLAYAGIRTFRDDDELRVGEEIGPALLKAIKESKISIPIFSRDYASSKWCLRELAKMVECHNDDTMKQKIFPIFYDVEPSDVRHQTGSYEEAFRQHKNDFDQEIVQGWKKAMRVVGQMKGWELEKETNGYEGELVKIVVSKVLLELKKYYMVVTDNLVGIYHHEEEMTKLLHVGFNGVRIVRIHGMWIVKTTIAKVIYNKFSVLFDCCYFLPDVGETSQQHNGLLNLQNPHNAISALNPDQVRWAIKARVTAKGDIHCYNNDRGDGKVFSFDLLDSNGGEIHVTCFNAVVDRFYDAIEVGKVYLISKGSLKPAQKNFNHLKNEWEILLKATSTVELCLDEDGSIPRQQFSFRPISEIENAENNSILDIIGIVISVNPSMPIMKKNGMETQRRILNLKDGSGKSVELTLWGEFCNREGQQLQEMIDSGVFPVLAVKAGKINDFNGKSIESFSATQLFINPVLLPKSLQLQEDILAIPVTTVASKSAFSTSGRLLSPHRSRLHPRTLEALMCAQSWLWSELKDSSLMPDDATIQNILEDYDDHEEEESGAMELVD
uniref:TIR domain-containing protein n=1 Tax=Fagus sylvatica TaxID=28930 RepID=A0A2N9G3A3_FAGSY